MFVSDEMNGRLNARIRELAKVLYSPFKTYVGKYASLEAQVLVGEMAALKDETSKDIVDELRNIGQSVAKVISVLRQVPKSLAVVFTNFSQVKEVNLKSLQIHFSERRQFVAAN